MRGYIQCDGVLRGCVDRVQCEGVLIGCIDRRISSVGCIDRVY